MGKRYSVNTMEIKIRDNVDFSEFKEVLRNLNYEIAMYKNKKGRFIVWIFNPSIKIFKYSIDFDWLDGSVSVWIKDTNEALTRFNYRTLIQDTEESFHYEYVDYNLITDIPPINKEETQC